MVLAPVEETVDRFRVQAVVSQATARTHGSVTLIAELFHSLEMAECDRRSGNDFVQDSVTFRWKDHVKTGRKFDLLSVEDVLLFRVYHVE